VLGKGCAHGFLVDLVRVDYFFEQAGQVDQLKVNAIIIRVQLHRRGSPLGAVLLGLGLGFGAVARFCCLLVEAMGFDPSYVKRIDLAALSARAYRGPARSFAARTMQSAIVWLGMRCGKMRNVQLLVRRYLPVRSAGGCLCC